MHWGSESRRALLTPLAASLAGRPKGRVQHDVAAGRAGRGPDREDSDAMPQDPPGAPRKNLRHALGVRQQVCLVSLRCLAFVVSLKAFIFCLSYF